MCRNFVFSFLFVDMYKGLLSIEYVSVCFVVYYSDEKYAHILDHTKTCIYSTYNIQVNTCDPSEIT